MAYKKLASRITVLVLLLLSSIGPALAQWSIGAQLAVDNFNCGDGLENRTAFFEGRPELGHYCSDGEATKGLKNPFDGYLWDGLRIYTSWFSSDFNLPRQFKFKVEKIPYCNVDHEKTLDVGTIFYEGEGSELVIALPALFQGYKDAFISRSMDLITRRGYSAVIVPNPFSREYLDHKPTCSTGNFLREAEIAYNVIRQIKENWGDKFSKIHLVGVSYGAFLSSVIVAMDSQRDQIIDGRIVLLGPPLDLFTSLHKFDEIIDDTSFWQGSQALVAGYIQGKVDDYLKAAKRNDLKETDGCSVNDELLASYEKELHELVENRPDQARMVSTGADAQDEEAKPLPINFINAIRRESPDVYKLFRDNQSDLTKLSFWLQQSLDNGIEDIRIVTSKDDYINDFNDWLELPEELLSSHHLLVRATGGHVGFLFTDWYENFVSFSFY